MADDSDSYMAHLGKPLSSTPPLPQPTERGWELLDRFRTLLSEHHVCPTALVNRQMALALEGLFPVSETKPMSVHDPRWTAEVEPSSAIGTSVPFIDEDGKETRIDLTRPPCDKKTPSRDDVIAILKDANLHSWSPGKKEVWVGWQNCNSSADPLQAVLDYIEAQPSTVAPTFDKWWKDFGHHLASSITPRELAYSAWLGGKQSASSARKPTDESAWLVELPRHSCRLNEAALWWIGGPVEPHVVFDKPCWSLDANEAVRFPRKEDAIKAIASWTARWLTKEVKITEHIFIGAAQ